MADAIAIAKTALLADLERLASYGQNVANSGTTAYKRQVPVSVQFQYLLSQDGAPARIYGSSGLTFTGTDLSPGALNETGRPLDLALEDNAFLVVHTPNGLRYTRRGDLHLDAAGTLCVDSGDPVVGAGADIRLSSDQVTISSTGAITAGDQQLGQLQIARFEDPAKLVYEGRGLFNADAASIANRSDLPRVRQGFLEASNVQPAHDMLGLMETTRHFDLVHNVVTAYDQMLDAAINNLT